MRKPFLLSLLAALLTTLSLHAYEFQSGDLYYNITSDTTVKVTYKVANSYNYPGLTTATIPATVTYNGTTYSVTCIGDSAFYGCSSLTSIPLPLPNSVTSIGESAFVDCSSLTSIPLPNSVTSIGGSAFWGCSSLTSITIPNSVTRIGYYAFENCSSLTSIVVESGNTMYDSRENCNAIIETASNTLIAGGQSTTIPNSVTSIGEGAFYGCSSLTSITIPNSVTSIGEGAFYGCSSLTSITIPNSVTRIGSSAFSDVPNVVYSGTATGTPWGARSVNGYVDGYFVYADDTKTHLLACSAAATGEITLPNSVTSIGGSAFGGCSSLTSITIPNSVTSIGDYAFWGCTSLTSITIPNSVTSIGSNAFYNVLNIVYSGTATGSPWGARSVNGYVDGYFVYADDTKTHLLACSAAATGEITLPNSVISIGGSAFYGCSSLTSITIGNSVTSIGGRAFWGCSSLTSITLPNSVISIGERAFKDCSSLTSITLPNSITSIESNAFGGCSSLTSITIPNSVTSIGDYAFWGCTSLTSITIPNSVTSIGAWAFEDCSSLTSITSLSCTPPSCGFGVFYDTPSEKTLVVPSISMDAYKNSSTWKEFTSFESIVYPSITLHSSDSTLGIAQIDQDVDCDSVAIISATATPGCQFTQWSDGNTDNPRTIKLTQDTTLTAEFAPNQYTLTTTTNYAERGTAQGDTIADYLTELQVSATANYGYHFTQWSDGNTNNPRTISLTKDTNLVALFEKNQYTITTTCNAEQGNASEPQTAEYLDEVIISATANYGYHFTQWSDGNTDNPRTIKLTQDTTFTAEFAPNQYTLTTTTNYAERGIAQGDTIADYLTELQVSATANYGYHFTQWSDGNTNNPRTISLTKDTNLVALFEKNQYTITTSCNAEQGTISGTKVAEYLDKITLNVLPNVGCHFTQWTDSNTDNPRTFTLTQDTTFAAEFAMDYSGKCGDELYWAYSNQEIKITGSGAMYNYTDSTMPWTLLRDSILTVRVGNNATSIGEYAFSNTPKLAELHIGTNVENIGANAFSGCRRLYDIYCNPTYPPFAETNSFANYNVYVHVPCASLDAYDVDVVFGSFKYVECIGSEDAVITDKTVTVVPADADATFTWPVTDNAETYSLVITKDGVTFCTLVFNAQGQLVSIAFKPRRQNAPAAEGTTPATYAEMTANGFRFTVTGLDEGAAYAYTLTVRNAANTVLETYTGDFTTLSNTPTGISDSPDATETVSDKGAEKLLRNGQVLIIRNGETYDMMGQTR